MSKTMAYGILYLIHHPDIQKKAQNEIDQVTRAHLLPLFEPIILSKLALTSLTLGHLGNR